MSAPVLRGEYQSFAGMMKNPQGMLGAICFSCESPRQAAASTLILPVPMQRLDAPEAVCEVWRCSGEVTQGQCADIRYRHGDGALFGVIALPENRFAPLPGKPLLQHAAESAYRQIFGLLDKLGYPYLYRFWNYIADINASSFGMERYQQFNIGRQDAFLAHNRGVLGNAPAACALGMSEGPLCIAFIAGKAQSLNIENPRQISACRYPRQYGPRSPTFSRATLVPMGQEAVLFISGTASILGHETVHLNDAVLQAREAMANIKAVLDEANRQSADSGFGFADLNYRVYIRRPADLAPVRAELVRIVGGQCNAVYLQADICRSDLLLEIEAVYACKMR
jgi:chorismate lyase / 3-hydroxybenzoate synthase